MKSHLKKCTKSRRLFLNLRFLTSPFEKAILQFKLKEGLNMIRKQKQNKKKRINKILRHKFSSWFIASFYNLIGSSFQDMFFSIFRYWASFILHTAVLCFFKKKAIIYRKRCSDPYSRNNGLKKVLKMHKKNKIKYYLCLSDNFLSS